MKSKFLELIRKHQRSILYVLFGAVTTLVNYGVYYPLYNSTNLSATVINVIAWSVSVVVAFMTNKPFVFCSHSWAASVVCPEFIKFVSSRLASGLLETGFLFLTVDLLNGNGNVWKVAVSIFVLILNYLTSRFLVFKRK